MTSTPFPSPQADVMNWLSIRQYVKPHEPLESVLALFSQEAAMNVPRDTIDGIALSTRIGRLSRSQLESIALRLVNSPHPSTTNA